MDLSRRPSKHVDPSGRCRSWAPPGEQEEGSRGAAASPSPCMDLSRRPSKHVDSSGCRRSWAPAASDVVPPLLRLRRRPLCFAATIPTGLLWRAVPGATGRHLYAGLAGATLSYLSFGATSYLLFVAPMVLGYLAMLLCRRRVGLITFLGASASSSHGSVDSDAGLHPKVCMQTSTSVGLEQILPWLFYHKVIGVAQFLLFVKGKAAKPHVAGVLESIPGVKVVYRTRELEEQQARRLSEIEQFIRRALLDDCIVEAW